MQLKCNNMITEATDLPVKVDDPVTPTFRFCSPLVNTLLFPSILSAEEEAVEIDRR